MYGVFTMASYFMIGNLILFKYIRSANPLIAYGVPMMYGAISSVVFLYIFSHDDFFKFAKAIEKAEEKQEKKWLRRFKHGGKATTTFAIGALGGPIFAALTARFLLTASRFRYLVVLLANIPSTMISVGLIKGVITIIV